MREIEKFPAELVERVRQRVAQAKFASEFTIGATNDAGRDGATRMSESTDF